MKKTSIKSLTCASLIGFTLAVPAFADAVQPVPCFPFGLGEEEANQVDAAEISDALAQWTFMGVFSADPGFLSAYQHFKTFLDKTNLLAAVSKEAKLDGSTVYHLEGWHTVGGDAVDGNGTLDISVKVTDSGAYKYDAVYLPDVDTRRLPGKSLSEHSRLAVNVFLDMSRLTLEGTNQAIAVPVTRFLSVHEQDPYVTKVYVEKQNDAKTQTIHFVSGSGGSNVLTVIRTVTGVWPSTMTYSAAFGPF